MDFPYTEAPNPAVLTGRLKAGDAVFVNLLPLKNGYSLVIAEVEMLSLSTDTFTGSMRGWMKPKMSIARFLERYSIAGATHHSALVYDTDIESLAFFGWLMDFDVKIIC